MNVPAPRRNNDLTATFKRAMVILLEDKSATKQGHYWEGRSGRKIFTQTIIALYDRYLVKLVVESRHRKLQTAFLTEVGEYAARQIRREFGTDDRDIAPSALPEKSAQFIAEVMS